MLIHSVVPCAPVRPASRVRPPVAFTPAVDVVETADAFVFTAELAGLAEGDFDVTVEENGLTLKGEKKAPQADESRRVLRSESVGGTFSRSYRLPFEPDPDAVKATFRNGMLTVRVGKPAASQVRSIPITSA